MVGAGKLLISSRSAQVSRDMAHVASRNSATRRAFRVRCLSARSVPHAAALKRLFRWAVLYRGYAVMAVFAVRHLRRGSHAPPFFVAAECLCSGWRGDP